MLDWHYLIVYIDFVVKRDFVRFDHLMMIKSIVFLIILRIDVVNFVDFL
jgi:hypothetical protein